MKKIFLALCVLLSATSAFAFEWEKLIDNTHHHTGEKYTLYFDKQSFQKAKQNQSNIKQVWEKTERPAKKISIVTLVDIDCQNRAFRRNKSYVYDLSETKLLTELDITNTRFVQWQNIFPIHYAAICR